MSKNVIAVTLGSGVIYVTDANGIKTAQNVNDLLTGATLTGALTISGALTLTAAIALTIGTVTTGISFTGTITGNGIDFTSITIVPSGSGGTALIRAGSYGDPAVTTFVQNSSANQGGFIRLYGATSGTGTSYDRGVFVCLVTTNTKNVMPVAGLAEIRTTTGVGVTNTKAAEFIVDMHTIGAKLAANGKLYAVWAKITCKDGGTVSSTGTRVAAIWLDNQMHGVNFSNNIVEEYTIYSTTGGSVPHAWAGFSTSSSGWAALFAFDSTCYNIAPVSALSCATNSGGSNGSLIITLNGVVKYIPYFDTAT